MSAYDVFENGNEIDSFISRIFNKKNIKDIINWFKYIETKSKLNKNLELQNRELLYLAKQLRTV